MFCHIGLKYKAKVKLPCITYKSAKFNIHDSNNKEAYFLQVSTYKDIIKYHWIWNGMCDMFNVQHNQDPTKKVDIFSHICVSKLKQIKSYVKGLRKNGYQQ